MSDISNDIAVTDHDELITIAFDDCVKYHGRDSIGGLALGFRLMQLAFADLAPGRTPDRTEVSFITTFPGPGLRDAVEMISRAVTRGCYAVVEASNAPEIAPESPGGPLWFRIRIGEREACYAAVPGAMGQEFVRLGRLSRSGTLPPEDRPRWTALKSELAATILAAGPGAYLRRL